MSIDRASIRVVMMNDFGVDRAEQPTDAELDQEAERLRASGKPAHHGPASVAAHFAKKYAFDHGEVPPLRTLFRETVAGLTDLRDDLKAEGERRLGADGTVSYTPLFGRNSLDGQIPQAVRADAETLVRLVVADLYRRQALDRRQEGLKETIAKMKSENSPLSQRYRSTF
jgi:hypothetical protein